MATTRARAGSARLRAVPLRALGDDRLARLAARGDRQAFAVIFERYHQEIFRYCRSIVLNADDAADALQNTMAAALRGIDGEERALAVKPWLYRIAHNESISLLRRRRPDAELDAGIADTLADSCDREGARERLRELVADLTALPDRQRGALLMRELSGLAYEDIARALAMSPGGAKQTVYEARRALADLAEGRTAPCHSIRELISAHDGRRLAGRRVRSHLRDCAACRAFRDDIGTRASQLAMLAPPLAPLPAADMLQGLLGDGGGTGTGGLMSLIAGTAGQAGAAGAGAKSLAVAAIVVSGGTAGVAVATDPFAAARAERPAPSAEAARHPGGGAAARGAERAAALAAAGRGARSGEPQPDAGDESGRAPADESGRAPADEPGGQRAGDGEPSTPSAAGGGATAEPRSGTPAPAAGRPGSSPAPGRPDRSPQSAAPSAPSPPTQSPDTRPTQGPAPAPQASAPPASTAPTPPASVPVPGAQPAAPAPQPQSTAPPVPTMPDPSGGTPRGR